MKRSVEAGRNDALFPVFGTGMEVQEVERDGLRNQKSGWGSCLARCLRGG